MKEKTADNSKAIELLLVDDEERYVNILSKRLSRRNMNVTTAISGEAAIQKLRKRDFQVVVLDLKMEDMDGLEVLRIMKKMVPDIRVIMLTGHGSETAARDGIQLGACDYLTKPCDLNSLTSAIKRAARQR